MSQVDERKYVALKDGLAAGFGRSAVTMDGSESILDQAGSSAVKSLTPQQYTALSAEQQAAVDTEVRRQEQMRAQRAYADVQAEADRLIALRKRIDRALRGQELQRDVVASIDRRGLVVSLVSRHVVFDANVAELTPRGRQVVATVAKVLRRIPDPLQVDGHTNQVPVQPKYYATDWDLSAARSITVLRFLNEEQGISAERLSAAAFGTEKPLIDPKKPGSQRINKRVDIVVLSSLQPEGRELLEQAAQERGDRT